MVELALAPMSRTILKSNESIISEGTRVGHVAVVTVNRRLAQTIDFSKSLEKAVRKAMMRTPRKKREPPLSTFLFFC
jgi:monoamine oxidase